MDAYTICSYCILSQKKKGMVRNVPFLTFSSDFLCMKKNSKTLVSIINILVSELRSNLESNLDILPMPFPPATSSERIIDAENARVKVTAFCEQE
jgi:hypothetical protein